jgi:hypothetical protein
VQGIVRIAVDHLRPHLDCPIHNTPPAWIVCLFASLVFTCLLCFATPVQLFTDTIEDDRAAMKEAGMQALLKQQQGQEVSGAAPPSSGSSSGNKGGTGKAAGAGGAAPAAVGANKVTGKAKSCVVC